MPDLRLDAWATSGTGTDADPFLIPAAAVNAAMAVDGTGIFVPPKRFRSSGPLVGTGDNGSLIGVGRASVIEYAQAGATILTIRHATDYLTNENERVGWTIEGITFDGGGLSAFAFEPKNVSNSKFCNLWFVNVALGANEYAVRTRRFLCNQCDSWRFDADESTAGQAPRNAIYLGYYADHPSGLGGDSYCTQCTFQNLYANRLTGTVYTFGQIFGATFIGSGSERCNRAMFTDGFHCFDMLFLACDMEANPVVTPTAPMVDGEPTHSYFDGSRSTWISCYSGETRLRFPATSFHNKITGGAWSTIQDDGERNEFDGVETPGYVITGSGYQKGRVVKRARFVLYDSERPHIVAGWGGAGEVQGYAPLVVRNTYDGTGGNVNALSLAILRVCAYNRATALGVAFGQAGLSPTSFSAERYGDAIIVAPGTSRVILGNEANPATAAVHDGVMWVGTQTFQGVRTLSGSGTASPAIIGDASAPTSLNVFANGTGVATVNLVLNGNIAGFVSMSNDALHIAPYGDYAPTDGASFTNIATLRIDRYTSEVHAPAKLSAAGNFAVNGKTPAAPPTLNAAATDAATTQALVNQLRAALINNGLAV
jgi:hypothetical protein